MVGMTIVAAADGSALGNPGASGWAWKINDTQWRAGGWSHATNNQAELMAVLSLLEETSEARNEPLHIICDSQYVINSLTTWLPGWKSRGWRKADGKPVGNQALLQRLDAALTGREVTFEWVRGHTGHPLNEAVDNLARKYAEAVQIGVTPETGPGFSSTSVTSSLDPDGTDTGEQPVTLF